MCVEGGEKMETFDLCKAPNEKSSDLATSHPRAQIAVNIYKVIAALLCQTVPMLVVDEDECGPVALTVTRGNHLEKDPTLLFAKSEPDS